MSKTSINREVALAGQRVRRKVIFALVLCSVIPLLLLTYAFHAPVREFLGPLFGLAGSVSIPALLTFTALLMAGGAFIVWDIATALSRAAQLSNEQNPELPTEPSRKDEIGTLMGSFARMLATIEQQSQEINEFPRRLDQLIREAFRDSLTGLPNRALFMDRLTHALIRAERTGTNLAVLFLDLDRFKILNDTLGQEVGDRLLVEVGHRLAACLSPEDTVARLGGDEFALLLEDASDLNGATALAERVSAEIQRPFVVEGRDVLISASIGVALTGGGSMQPEEVLHNADLAMYQAKAEGRARYELYEPGLNVSTRERLDLQADLRTAGARQELSLRYQPVVALGNLRPVEVEALVRWTHPRLGPVPPGEFVPLAEQTGGFSPREIREFRIQQQAVSVRHGVGVITQAVQFAQQTLGVLADGVTSAVRVQVDLAERKALVRVKRVFVLLQIGAQVAVRGLNVGREIVGDELHLLAESPADDGIIAIKPQGNGLAREHLLANVSPNQPVKLFRGWRSLPAACEGGRQALDLARSHHDFPGAWCPTVEDAIGREQESAKQGEMKERLAKKATHHRRMVAGSKGCRVNDRGGKDRKEGRGVMTAS